MPTIVIPAGDGIVPAHCIRAVESAGGQVNVVTPGAAAADVMDGAGGLLLADAGLDDAVSSLGLDLLAAALAADRPVLATGMGMHALNGWFGGLPAPLVGGHDAPDDDASDGAESPSPRHQIYLSPGSKVAAIIGSAGMFRVNSRHRLGLREAQRAERLMTIAYQLDDGIIEGLESKEHRWVIGVQFLPERADELPASFNNLFLGLVERAEEFAAGP